VNALLVTAGAADRLPVGRENDVERYLRRAPGWRRQNIGSSVTIERARPHSASSHVSSLLDSVQRLVHDVTARDTVPVVRRPRPQTEPHHPRPTASRQSTDGTTQRSRGAPAP